MKTGKELARKSSYTAGDPIIRPFVGDMMAAKRLTRVAHLATNENQHLPSPKIMQAMCEALEGVNLYPDPSSTLLRRKIAEKYNISERMVTVGNGADELLYTVGKAFIEEGENAVISTPCYPTALRGINSMGGEVRAVDYRLDFTCDIEGMLAAIDGKTKLVMLCTPGNPNTRIITKAELAWFMERVPENILVVMDEAYREFISREDAADPMIYFEDKRNILFLRTFSKFYSLAGLRVGYALGPEHTIDVLRRSIPSFPVNVVAQAAAIAALDDAEYYEGVYKTMVENREFLTKALFEAGLAPVPESQTNFLFVDTGNIPPEVLVNTLFERGIHIRGAVYPPHNRHVRITVGTMEQNRRIAATAAELARQYG